MLAQIGLGGPYGPTYGSKRIARRISDIWPGTERTIFVFLTSLTSEFGCASCRPSLETGQHLEALPKRLIQKGVTGPMRRRALVRTSSYFAVVVMLGTGKWMPQAPRGQAQDKSTKRMTGRHMVVEGAQRTVRANTKAPNAQEVNSEPT